ncbi:MAG TPA: hypothetical protein PLV13_08660 [Ilumatobacteraceae bacterium]|nr:hypothetical protein [Ilumatobacteraceae bacterium]
MVVEIRNPPFMLRGVQIRWDAWFAKGFLSVGDVEVAIGSWTFAPVALECSHGAHSVMLLDRQHRLVKSALVDVERDCITIVTVFPPTESLLPSKMVRKVSAIESVVLDSR